MPEEHRTDSLSAAFNNLAEREELTRRYDALCQHYGMRATRNNPGVSHENGSIESRQGTLKRALDQALLLRGSRDFDDLAGYGHFVAETVRRLNARTTKALAVERACLQAAAGAPHQPTTRRSMPGSASSPSSAVKSVLYTVPSRLVGHRLKVRLYEHHIECWLGGHAGPRVRRGCSARAPTAIPAHIDCRHLLPALKRKPGAFARWVLRDAMFPRSEYRQTWEQLIARLPEREACTTDGGSAGPGAAEAAKRSLAHALAQLLERDELPDLERCTIASARGWRRCRGDRCACPRWRLRRTAGGAP